MDNERIREVCMALPHVTETLNWGQVLVYWVGDVVLSFHCGAERFHELQENEGICPAPHLGRAHWVALERWDALRPREIEEELQRAHALIYEKLPKHTKAALALPEKERGKLVRERTKMLAEKAKAGKG